MKITAQSTYMLSLVLGDTVQEAKPVFVQLWFITCPKRIVVLGIWKVLSSSKSNDLKGSLPELEIFFFCR